MQGSLENVVLKYLEVFCYLVLAILQPLQKVL